jgi:acetyl-CoA carboxylase biotin carboxylase subunit
MRIAHNEASLRANLRGARAEAEAAFGNGELYVEKFIEKPRHVEVQILGDRHGNYVHLWERDCTVQRRYQKLIEETPSPHIGPETRKKLCEAAVRLARAAEYSSAGTVEFLVGPKQTFYFIEANTRIQVEHPVTEMVTGLDLIKLQIRVAAGEALPIRQRSIPQKGSSIECRINAEDPADGFRPSPGRIEVYRAPGGPGVRVDTVAHAGYRISPAYDSLIAKLIVHQPTRREAIACMSRALSEFRISPVKTTIPLLSEIMSHPDFVEGNLDTGFVERFF